MAVKDNKKKVVNKTKVEDNLKQGKKHINIPRSEIIGIALLLVIIAIYFLSPKIYVVTTARYGQGSEDDNKNVQVALGKQDTEERFKLYFQWYNVIHELGHGILIYNSDIKLNPVEEEQLVNDFAVAYWLYYGEEDKINLLSDIVDYASKNIKSDAKEGVSYMDFATDNWNSSAFFTFNNYGWFQFNSVKESLNNKKDLETVLKEMKVKNFELTEQELLTYANIDEKVSTEIINDAVDNFHAWGLEFPEVTQFFSNDPNTNQSRPGRNFLGIYNLIN